ncbi:L-seryl-tRNA(Sec) selenium transferase [Mycoplasmatota bacterium]|nr:L-seryl-tRNA(Sec) selenium transferase [Mycoplasmatota bacterium]
MQELYRKIPQVSKLIEDKSVRHFLSYFYMEEIKQEIEVVLKDIRSKIKSEFIVSLNYEDVVSMITNRLRIHDLYSLRRVINGTGTVLHTNLGRAVMSKNAIDNVVRVCKGYSNLEYDIEAGKRGSRYDHLEAMVSKIVGSESAVVVNNNAAATMLTVAAFSTNKEAVVSRGELVEIGGSFRIPEIIEASGAILKEVGTTNRTHLIDYERATSEKTGMYLKVHPSNYHIDGFIKNVTNKEIVELAKETKVITCEDLGSGAIIDFSRYNFYKENMVQESLKSGIDLVTFSGDKLLGGPQAGIIVGKKELIDRIKKHPLTRAFRVGKMTIAALEATLRDYLSHQTVVETTPTLRMLFENKEELRAKATKLTNRINEIDYFDSEVIPVNSTVGGGSLPLSIIESYGISIKSKDMSVNDLEKFLRKGKNPVIGLINENRYYLDVRTLLNGDDELIVKQLEEYKNE